MQAKHIPLDLFLLLLLYFLMSLEGIPNPFHQHPRELKASSGTSAVRLVPINFRISGAHGKEKTVPGVFLYFRSKSPTPDYDHYWHASELVDRAASGKSNYLTVCFTPDQLTGDDFDKLSAFGHAVLLPSKDRTVLLLTCAQKRLIEKVTTRGGVIRKVASDLDQAQGPRRHHAFVNAVAELAENLNVSATFGHPVEVQVPHPDSLMDFNVKGNLEPLSNETMEKMRKPFEDLLPLFKLETLNVLGRRIRTINLSKRR